MSGDKSNEVRIAPRLARCRHGCRGIILSFGVVTYQDGSSAYAWRGRHFPKVWRRWSSRAPRRGWFR